MAKLQKVLVAYDGSPQSKEALYWAIYFSRRTGASICAVKVFEPFFKPSRLKEVANIPDEIFEHFAEAQKKDLQMMEAVKELGKEQEVPITTEVLSGHVAQALLGYAKEHNVSMIVTGTRGFGALKQLLIGSATHSLVSASHIPVMVVKKCPVVQYTGKSMILSTLREILVAYDGYPQSRVALDWALEIAKHIDAHVTVVKVFEPFQVGLAYTTAEGGNAPRTAAKLREMEELNRQEMQEVKEYGTKMGVKIDTEILQGSVLQTLLEYAEKNGIDMVVVGAQGHGMLDRLPLGSVPHGLISLSPIPVLVVKE